ncbi:MAG: LPS export ABC transporter periplasmic protein LptC [Proteobacteria bacterium]|nr:LPS export ABC transporter periplasmic protein LptC [Pseudomonadota bacterium]
MISRKKKLFIIQLTIFFVASTLLYKTYQDKKEEPVVQLEAQTDPNVNSFNDIEYSGFDLNGNRYVLRAEKADFKTETPELINMKIVFAKFYLKDNTILSVTSDLGLYNNKTLDIEFKDNVKADYSTHTLLSDLLSYSNLNAKLIAAGNVRGKSLDKGEFFSDNLEYNLTDKTLNFSMSGTKQVNVKINEKKF